MSTQLKKSLITVLGHKYEDASIAIITPADKIADMLIRMAVDESNSTQNTCDVVSLIQAILNVPEECQQ